MDQYVTPTSVDWLQAYLNQNFVYAKSAYGSFSDQYLYVVAEQDGRAEDVNDLYVIGGLIGYDDLIGPYRTSPSPRAGIGPIKIAAGTSAR